MKKNLKMYLGTSRLRTIAHRCDKILGSGLVTAHYAWYGTSTGGSASVWGEFVQNFLEVYRREYSAGFHQLVAAATLLSQSKLFGIHNMHHRKDHEEFMFSCNLNDMCQMGKAGNFDYVPMVTVETEMAIKKALRCSAFRDKFVLKIKVCDKPDGDPRTAKDLRITEVKFKIPKC